MRSAVNPNNRHPLFVKWRPADIEGLKQVPERGIRIMPATLLVGLEKMHRHWFAYLLFGLVMLLFGVLSISEPFIGSLASLAVLGWLLVFNGLAQTLIAFVTREWSGFFMHLLGGILEIVVGVLVVGAPISAALGLTLMLAMYLLVGGMFRMVVSLLLHFPGWGWGAFGGLISFLLGLALWKQWTTAGLVFIGTCVGVALVLQGISWVVFGLNIRKLPIAAKS